MPPIRIEAENYTGYYDTTTGNSGSVYRTDNVDIQATTDVGGGYNVGWTKSGEWLTYNFELTEAGFYDLTTRVASGTSGTKTLRILIDGVDVTGSLSFTDASGWQSWRDLTKQGLNLSAGQHEMRVEMVTGNLNFNYIELTPAVSVTDAIAPTASLAATNVTTAGAADYTFTVTYQDNQAIDLASLSDGDVIVTGPNGFQQAPTLVSVNTTGNGSPRTATYRITAPGGSWDDADNGTYAIAIQSNQVRDTSGNAVIASNLGSFQATVAAQTGGIALPGRVQAEDYVSSSDTTTGNSGAVYRNDNVDIEATADIGGGYNIGWVKAGEWLTYDINVAQTGFYDLTARVASAAVGTKSLRIKIDGQDMGTLSLTDASGWQSWQNITKANVNLTAGRHQLRVEMLTDSLNLNYIDFTPVPVGRINGTNSAETLNGDALDNIISAFGGNDILNGGEGNDLLNGGFGSDALDGGLGNDTASYAQSSSGVSANLATGLASAILRIMPLGDSITHGMPPSNPLAYPGAYRIPLWERFKTDSIPLDFVGSQRNGSLSENPDSPDGFDQDHEGYPGKKISEIATSTQVNLNPRLQELKPNVILLTIGTNDAMSTRSVDQMKSDLGKLIDQITSQRPDVQLLVSTIPPINPSRSSTAAQKAIAFNNSLPTIISTKAAAGKKVALVDTIKGNDGQSGTADDLVVSDLVSDGLHPNEGGYNKIANTWYDAIFKNVTIDRDTFNSIENLTGSDFDDILVGNNEANVLEGSNGKDQLTGMSGADTFAYRNLLEAGDIITDFAANDLLQVSAAGFGGGLVAGVALSAAEAATGVFVSGSNPTAIGSSANFLYNATNGVLSFDQDGVGSGTAVAIATFNTLPSLSANQFMITA
ncbi:carbohydrate-binding protein [Trichocoleus desertorum]|uniref:carbohydrate-binding protein n=1 Tax=Trichocoleus desertorum TaxID=1481672 RepID=UPI00329940FA